MIGATVMRAEVLRVLHKATLGMPDLTTTDLAGQSLSPAERGLLEAAGDDDLALLNAFLQFEHEQRAEQFAALERLLTYCQFEDGPLGERVTQLPDRAFACAATDLYALGWVTVTDYD